MAAFSVTTAEMTKKISDLRAKNQSLKQQVSKMKESKDELNTTWDGNCLLYTSPSPRDCS